MKHIYFLLLIIFALGSTTVTKAQSKSFLKMTEKEKSDFVAVKTDEITNAISGKKYLFSTNFKAQVSAFVEAYASRVGNNIKKGAYKQDLTFVVQRGSEYAPMINAVFDKYQISRLSGLYIAMIESEFDNNLVSPTGGSGVFILTAAQAGKYRMTKKDITNPKKSAEIAARRLGEAQNYFGEYRMKEYLAIMSWNRATKKINFDIRFKFMSDSENVACPICGLTENPQRFDRQFQTEAVKYIPKFLAAAIVGENPGIFGLNTEPLSTLSAKNMQSYK